MLTTSLVSIRAGQEVLVDTEQLLLTVFLDGDSKDITLRRNGEGRSVQSLFQYFFLSHLESRETHYPNKRYKCLALGVLWCTALSPNHACPCPFFTLILSDAPDGFCVYGQI